MKTFKNTFFINRGALLFFIGVFIWLWYLNAIFPTQSDDMGAGYGGVSAAIHSYYTWNGRFGELLRVSFGSYLATTVWYAPINAFIGASVMLLLFFIVFARFPSLTLKDSSIFLILISFLLVDIGFSFGAVFYWAAGSFNYLWTWLLLFLWMLPYRLYWQRVIDKQPAIPENKLLKTFFLLIIGFCAGWSTEFGIVFVVLQVCFIVYQYTVWKGKLPLWYFIGIASFFAGWFFLYTSPGTAARVQLIVSHGTEFFSLSDLFQMPFLTLVETVFHTYNKSLRWILEIYALFSVFLLIVLNVSNTSLCGFLKTAALIVSLGICFFVFPYFFFIPYCIAISVVCIYKFRNTNIKLARVFAAAVFLLFAEFLFIGATIQTSIPIRAGFHYGVLNFALIAIVMNYCFDTFQDDTIIQKRAYMFCAALSLVIVLCVSVECYAMYLKWQKMEQSIELQKMNGIRNVIVDKDVFISRYWGYSNWDNPDENFDEWPNTLYANFYGVDTFTAR
ncbi:MAG: DUF6056 family protein [Treponema phagedenis]|uniref:DUF6056 family protein n=1 Tax=Treponema phagedenis TaxID=162 RepID=UPI003134047B